MKASAIPTRFPIPFAADAGSSYIRPIPEASQIGVTPGAASLFDGFPPVTMQPISSSGVPPFGQDMNGILFQTTSWSQWQNVGGPVPYDATLSSAIGGYPGGTILTAATSGAFWFSTADDNTSNPNSGGANWVGFTPIDLYAVDSGSANAGAASFVPTPASLAFLVGRALRIKKVSSANTGGYTLNINGFGANNVKHADGSALGAGELPANGIFSIVWDGTQFELQSSATAGGVSFSQLQVQGGNSAVDTGTANALVVTLSTVPVSLAAITGSAIRITKANAANTGAATLAVNSLTATPIIHADGTAVVANELPANGEFSVVYDGSNFILQSLTGYAQVQALNGVRSGSTGSVTGAGGTKAVTFAVPFPNACTAVVITGKSISGSSQSRDAVTAISPTGFTIQNAGNTADFYYAGFGS